MANELTIFDNKASMPAHVAGFFQEESNIADRVTVPTLSYEGKVWTIGIDGAKTKLMRRNAEGDEEPVSVMRVVILDYAKRRGRTYYPGAYDPAKIAQPACWSDDGVTPDASIAEPQAKKCEGCPRSIKGDRITEQGKAVASCSAHRMIAVVPANKQDFQVLRMKLAITSLWDKTSDDLAAQKWFAFDNYTDYMRANNVQHTAALVTKMRFDPNVAYPKVIFSPDRWLTEEELAVIAPRVKSEEVTKLLAGTWTPAGIDGKRIAAPAEGDDDTEADARAVAAANKRAEEDAAAARATAAAQKAAAAQAAKAAKAKAEEAAKASVVAADDGDVEIILPGKSSAPNKAAKPAEAKTVSTVIPEDLNAILGEWGED